MSLVQAVIGSSYGDEGKGNVTNALSNRDTLVVRFNGGAQAGHTVVHNGRRHVFHHFGSGTLKGAATFLSEYFIVNPILFVTESKQLEDLNPTVYIDPMSPVTTPYDMMLNAAVENSRGAKRHGSCGVGINETITRGEMGFGLNFSEIQWYTHLFKWLKHIRDKYVPARMLELGLTRSDMPPNWDSEEIIERWLKDVEFVFRRCIMRRWRVIAESQEHIVFEGAQGLRLDERAPGFPHVTRSRTGLTNVVSLMKLPLFDKDTLETYYVTRPYITRHGIGPLSHEIFGKTPYEKVVDLTNKPHPFQGMLRFAWLNRDEFLNPIVDDLEKFASARPQGRVRPILAITCMDQVENKSIKMYVYSTECEYSDPDLWSAHLAANVFYRVRQFREEGKS